jgi:hypothetical protein
MSGKTKKEENSNWSAWVLKTKEGPQSGGDGDTAEQVYEMNLKV